MYPQSMFWSKNKKNIKNCHLKIVIFTAVKYCCILHGRVFVMPFHTMDREQSTEVEMEYRLASPSTGLCTVIKKESMNNVDLCAQRII